MKKRLFLFIAFSAFSFSSMAQIDAFAQGNGQVIDGFTLPRTAIRVTISQEREVVIRGPYARFASQYLGIATVPMNDKESYKILDARISYFLEPDVSQTFFMDDKAPLPLRIFNWLTPEPAVANPLLVKDRDFMGGKLSSENLFGDMGIESIYGTTIEKNDLGEDVVRTAAVEKSVEQMASEAANTIFKLRKTRIELITGVLGENVFGGGLPAALKEIDRLENNYMALFVGKRFTQVTSQSFTVLPEYGKSRILVCRFSPAKGLVADTDMSATPINIELTADKPAATQPSSVVRKGVRMVPMRVPQSAVVKLVDNSQTVLATERMPIFQLGQLVEFPVITAQ